MPRCSVLVCKNTSSNVNYLKDGISFHTYPKDPYIKEQWIIATGRKPNWFPTKSSTICSSHFESKCFQPYTKIRRLFDFAVPTLKLRMMLTDLKESSSLSSPCINSELDKNEPDLIQVERLTHTTTATTSSSADKIEIQVEFTPTTTTTTSGSADEIETLVVKTEEDDEDDEEMPLHTSDREGTCSSMTQTSPVLEAAVPFDSKQPGPSDSPEILRLKHLVEEKSTVISKQAEKIEMLDREVNRLLARNQYLEDLLKESGISFDD